MNNHRHEFKRQFSCISLLISCLVLLCFFPVYRIAAESEPDDETVVTELDEVTITATKTEEDVLSVPQYVTVITAEEIRQSKSADLAEIIKKNAGISLVDYGPAGSLQALSIRGSTTSQVLILIDGVRAYGSHGGGDLSMISLENIERIEIVRGGSSALYGADAVGGVINLITRKKADNSITLSIENGSFLPRDAVESGANAASLVDSQKIHADASFQFDQLHLNLSANGMRAANEFTYPDADDKLHVRENSGLFGGDAAINVSYFLPDGFMNLSVAGIFHDQGVPGNSSYPSPDAHQTQTALGTFYQYKTGSFFTDALTLDLKCFYNYSQLDYENPDPASPVASLHTSHLAGLDFSQNIFPADFISILYGGAVSRESVQSTDIGDRDRISLAGFAEVPLYAGPSFTVFPSLRYDFFSDFGNSLTYKTGIAWNFLKNSAFKINLAKSFRAPSFNDLYWPADVFAEGNPLLKPEIGYSADAGVSVIEKDFSMNLFCFFRYMEDMILWLPGDDFIWRPSNFGKGLYPGIEAAYEVAFLKYLKASINYTFLYSIALTSESGDTFGIGDDRRIPYIPLHIADASLSFITEIHTITIHCHFEDKKFLSTDNTDFLPLRFIADADYSFALSKHFLFHIAIDNIFNQAVENMQGYPLPGFTLRTGCELKF